MIARHRTGGVLGGCAAAVTVLGVALAILPPSLAAGDAPAPPATDTDAAAPPVPVPPAALASPPPVAPVSGMNAANSLPTASSNGSESAPDIPTMEFLPTGAQFTIVKETPVYVSASADSPSMYPLPPGVGVQATEQSKDGKWVVALTEDGQAAFLPRDALGPYQPDAKPALPLLVDMVSGTARVLDTATLSVDGQPITLFGVLGETGILADQMQKQLAVSGAVVACQLHEQTYQCMLPNGADIARVVLYNGMARPGPDATDDYRQQAEAAKAAHRGIWK